jgi:DNA polymerase
MSQELAAHIDFETRATVDLKKAGVYRYAEHPLTGAICLSWRIGERGIVNRWRPGDEDPYELLAHIESGGRVVAHNAGFERTIWNWALLKRVVPHWPALRIEQQDCTMARGLALALPASLDQLGRALKTPMQKDKEGHALMMRMCKPRRIDPDGTVVWWDDEERVGRLMDYCDQDVETETDVDRSIPALSPEERRVWELDQTINDRGVMIDVKSVERALAVVEEALKRADDHMWWLTDGAVRKCSEAAKLVKWLNDRGIPCVSVAKGEVEEIVLATSIMGDTTAEEAIRLRRAAARTSTAKFKAMLNSVCSDGRVRGTLAYHGAATGRWAGRIMQPQNFLRLDADDLPDVMMAIDLLALQRSAKEIVDAIEAVIGPALETVAKCMRAMLVAPSGKKFVSGDFSNIEGRGAAWIADEHWKLEAFRAYDRGEGADLYKLSYARSFGQDVETVTKAERQIGKVQELALGYQGSVGAYIAMAAGYGIKPAQVAAVARTAVAPEEWHRVSTYYSDEDSRGLDQDTWTGVKCVVNAWRAAHPNIVQAWWDLQDAAIAAVGTPGLKVPVLNSRVVYLAANGFLYCRLPSGRVLCYAMPRMVRQQIEAPKKAHEIIGIGGEKIWVEATPGRYKYAVEYDAVNSYTKRWEPHRLYGGLQFNNVVQGLARDKLVASMFRVEAAGYPLVLTVHDENVSEVDTLFGSADEYQRIMAQPDPWCADMPVAVSAWEDIRYVK